jgi:hypothetical protein
LGTTAALNQNRTAIYHNGLPGAESFLHQKQIGLRYVMSLADSANRETLSHTFVRCSRSGALMLCQRFVRTTPEIPR